MQQLRQAPWPRARHTQGTLHRLRLCRVLSLFQTEMTCTSTVWTHGGWRRSSRGQSVDGLCSCHRSIRSPRPCEWCRPTWLTKPTPMRQWLLPQQPPRSPVLRNQRSNYHGTLPSRWRPWNDTWRGWRRRCCNTRVRAWWHRTTCSRSGMTPSGVCLRTVGWSGTVHRRQRCWYVCSRFARGCEAQRVDVALWVCVPGCYYRTP